jgi:uncharacterized membrane protein YkoI
MWSRCAVATAIAFLGLGICAQPVPAGDWEHARERAALKQARITMSDAIARAKRKVPGGKVVDSDLQTVGGAVRYAIDIRRNGVHRVLIHMQSGNVVSVYRKRDDDDRDDDDD